MTYREQLIAELDQLPPERVEAVAEALIQELKEQEWDRQVAADYDAGKLDRLIEHARADIAAGRTRDL